MAGVREELVSWLSVRAAEIVTDASDSAMMADRLAAAGDLDAAAFAGELLDLSRILGESARDAAAFKSLLTLPEFDDDGAREAALVCSTVAVAIAIGRVNWPSRRDARKARGLLIERAHLAYPVAGADGPDLYGWLANLVAIAVRLISDIAANATPIVQVQSGISLPSTVLAYQMYGDAKRAAGLVDIAGSATPMVMPVKFEALAT